MGWLELCNPAERSKVGCGLIYQGRARLSLWHSFFLEDDSVVSNHSLGKGLQFLYHVISSATNGNSGKDGESMA